MTVEVGKPLSWNSLYECTIFSICCLCAASYFLCNNLNVLGQLSLIVEHLQPSLSTVSRLSSHVTQSGDNSLLSTLNSMHLLAKKVAQLAQTTLQQNDERYYNLMKPLIVRPWKYARPFGQAAVSPELEWPASNNNNNNNNTDSGELIKALTSCHSFEDGVAIFGLFLLTCWSWWHTCTLSVPFWWRLSTRFPVLFLLYSSWV